MKKDTERVRLAVRTLGNGQYAVFECDERDFRNFRRSIQKAASRVFSEEDLGTYETQSFPALKYVKVWRFSS